LITGDIGYMAGDERLVLTGREKDLIVRSGHNIDPAAIEDVANDFPGVQMSSAVGMPDAYAGEVPILFVVSSPGHAIDLKQLQEHIEANVNEPPAKPKRIVLLESLPTTAVGKIFKPALRDLAVKEKVRAEVDRIFGAATEADINVEKDERLNTLVRVSVGSNDAALKQALAESLSSLPQIYRIEQNPSRLTEGKTGERVTRR
jgi:fatty-acyl-CoA synthase